MAASVTRSAVKRGCGECFWYVGQQISGATIHNAMRARWDDARHGLCHPAQFAVEWVAACAVRFIYLGFYVAFNTVQVISRLDWLLHVPLETSWLLHVLP